MKRFNPITSSITESNKLVNVCSALFDINIQSCIHFQNPHSFYKEKRKFTQQQEKFHSKWLYFHAIDNKCASNLFASTINSNSLCNTLCHSQYNSHCKSMILSNLSKSQKCTIAKCAISCRQYSKASTQSKKSSDVSSRENHENKNAKVYETSNDNAFQSILKSKRISSDPSIESMKILQDMQSNKLREGAPLEYDLRIHAGRLIHNQKGSNKKGSWSSEEEQFNEKVKQIRMKTLGQEDQQFTLEKQLEVVRERLPYEIKYESPKYDDMRNSAEIREELEREKVALMIQRYNTGKIDLPTVHKPFSERDIPVYQKHREETKRPISEIKEDFRQIKGMFFAIGFVPFLFCLYFLYNLFKDLVSVTRRDKEYNAHINEILKTLK